MLKKKSKEDKEYEKHVKNALSNFGGLSDENLELRCFGCKHFIIDNECKAFPGGIPLDIIVKRDLHGKIHPDQVGDFVYEPKS